MIAKDQTKIRNARAVLLAGGVALAASSLGACSAVVPSSPQSFAVTNPDGSIYDPATIAPPYNAPPISPAVGPVANNAATDTPPVNHAGLAMLTAPGLGHDATMAAAGYVGGKQAEKLYQKLKSRSLGVTGETAEETAATGAGTVAARTAAGRMGGTMATGEGGAAAAEGGTVMGEALGGEELAAGLAGGELLLGGGIIIGAGILAYEAYEHSQHEAFHNGQ
jgi:hypothetical protein